MKKEEERKRKEEERKKKEEEERKKREEERKRKEEEERKRKEEEERKKREEEEQKRKEEEERKKEEEERKREEARTKKEEVVEKKHSAPFGPEVQLREKAIRKNTSLTNVSDAQTKVSVACACKHVYMWVEVCTCIILDLYKDDNRVLYLSIIVSLDLYPFLLSDPHPPLSLPLSFPPSLFPSLLLSQRASWMSKREDCAVCNKAVYAMERLEVDKTVYHKTCFKCTVCNKTLG